jgi:hypothetical protein
LTDLKPKQCPIPYRSWGHLPFCYTTKAKSFQSFSIKDALFNEYVDF